MIKQAYINGFINKCTEHGVNPNDLLKYAGMSSDDALVQYAIDHPGGGEYLAHKDNPSSNMGRVGGSGGLPGYGDIKSMFNTASSKPRRSFWEWIADPGYSRLEAGEKSIVDQTGRILRANDIVRMHGGGYDDPKNRMYRIINGEYVQLAPYDARQEASRARRYLDSRPRVATR